jgi:hypothetical protein
MGVLFDIQSLLETSVTNITGYSASNTAWENGETDYSKKVGTKWWRVTNVTLNTELVTADGLQKITGILQIDVFVPMNKGSAELLTDLDNIYSHYSHNPTLTVNNTKVEIMSVGRKKTNFEEAWFSGFIEVKYNCYTY